MKHSSIYLFLPMLTLLFACSVFDPENGKDQEKEQNSLLGLLALSRTSTTSTSQTNQKFPTPTCEVSAPTFSTLKDAGFETTCGQSGCHVTGGSGASRYRANVYSEVLAYANTGVPSTSALYREQSSGSMAIYTTQAIDKAIYCWITGGAKP